MKRLWLILFAAMVLMVTDHGQFWMDDFSHELFPDDGVTLTVSQRISGFSLQALDLQPITLPISTVCPESQVCPQIVAVDPVEVVVPRTSHLVAAVLIRPPPVLA